MPTLLIVLLFLLGVVLIVKGGDAFVDAASWIAEAFHIPKFIVGATIEIGRASCRERVSINV